jgi:oxygen-dependent protoporphyrinogen oxidase
MIKISQPDMIVIGAGLTGLTLSYYLRKAGKNVLLIEESKYPGGLIRTITEDGFIFEAGANTGVVGSAELVQLFRDLNLEFEFPHSSCRTFWIWKEDKWHALPSGFFSAISTSLLSFKDKMKMLAEPFRRKKHMRNETVAKLFKRRLGRNFFKYVVDPLISAVYAGDPARLTVRFVFPKLYALERKYGSLLWGTIRSRKFFMAERSAGITNTLFSVKGGLENLIRELVSQIGEEYILTGVTNVQVQAVFERYACRFKFEGDDYQVVTEKLISTVDGLSVRSLFPFIPEEVIHRISAIRYAKVVQVVVGYRNWNGIPLRAFGGLVPSEEEKDILGILFPSAMFQERAPDGGALLSVTLAGIKRPDLYWKTDKELIRIVLEKMRKMMQCADGPDLIRIFRYEKGIPQYEFTSKLRLFYIQEIENAYPGLILAGNMRDGIRISDRVKQAKQIADELLA